MMQDDVHPLRTSNMFKIKIAELTRKECGFSHAKSYGS
jgi:hypothetical protein